jgi:anti-sigma regulatory factor (Ser/Thr protein kinase)
MALNPNHRSHHKQSALVTVTSGQVGLPVAVPARTAVVALPAEPAGVTLARHWTTGLLTLWGLTADDRSTAELVISELAANVVRYGHSEMTIRILQRRDRLHVCVTDSGASSAARAATVPQESAEHGRGLAIVQALAESIEATREPEGWRVGAVLRVATGGSDGKARAATRVA